MSDNICIHHNDTERAAIKNACPVCLADQNKELRDALTFTAKEILACLELSTKIANGLKDLTDWIDETLTNRSKSQKE